MLIDTHAHINEEVFGGANNIIDAMARDGLEHIICVGCDVKSSVESVEIARSDPRVFAAVGVHPYYPDEVTADSLKLFKELAADEKVVAIGEIGLDYHRDVYDREGQLRALAEQYSLAREVHLPIIFHVREATGDFCEFLSSRDFPESGVMHCFSGSVETAEICLKKGLYISFGGKLTYRNSTRLAEVAKFVPSDRLLIETDAPYLPPAQAMTSPNYPRNVRFVRDKLAELRGVSADEIERITSENAKRLFFKFSTSQLFDFSIFRGASMRVANNYVYVLDGKAYINLTNKCENACTFCIRNTGDGVAGTPLWLEKEPTAGEVMSAFDALGKVDNEVVFCGYGEPTLALDVLKECAAELKKRGFKTRLNTNGLANLSFGRDITPELENIDVVSVSLNSPTAEGYYKVTRSKYGLAAHPAVLDFASACKTRGIKTVLTVVDVIGDKQVAECRALVRRLGLELRVRKYISDNYGG